jgi:uncharacterized membrane protein (UPF0182 family)
MTAPTSLPRRRRRSSRSRVGIIAIVVLAFILLTSLRSVARFYTDYLWFKEVHLNQVFRGVLVTQVFLAVVFILVFFVLCFGNLFIADRLAPRFRGLGPEDELVQRYREVIGPHAGKVRLVIAALFAVFIGAGTAGHWNDYILFRNAASFGMKDPQFHRDAGFFVFQLPFLKFVADWVFVAIVIITILSVVFHYLGGSIRLQAQTNRVTPHVKVHISVLLGVLALVKAVQYYLDQFELDLSTSHVVHGATYTAVHAQLPAKRLLIVISVVSAILFLVNIWLRGWTLPVIAVGLWALVGLLAGAAYPAFIQKVKVEPNEAQREKPYIDRNIAATRYAYNFADVKEETFAADNTITADDITQNAATIANVRLWDPNKSITGQTYQRLQEIRSFYQFSDVDIDRYALNGQPTQTLTSVREINPPEIPDPTWVNRHLQFTHGYGAVLAPANAVTTDGEPDFLISSIPPEDSTAVTGVPHISEPRVYYGESSGGYAIVHTGQSELDFQDQQGNNKETQYDGKGGVPTGSFIRRAAFALRFGDYNFITSSLIKSDSKVIFVRDIGDRVRKAAPFLQYDKDPYSVILPDGRIVYIQDAYTTTSRFPYSEQADRDRLPPGSGLRNIGFNYARNSVKVVIDAYNGTMTFFVMDPQDPIVKTYEKAFPKLFTASTEMDKLYPGITSHLRYPEDLFRVQTNMYGRYHITGASDFYSKSNAWNIAQNPAGNVGQATTVATANAQGQLGPSKQVRMDPTYLLMRLPNETSESFLILQPFVPVSNGDKQQNLSAFMTAKSDPSDYGKLQVFVTPPGQFIDGPAIVNAKISQTPDISSQFTLLNSAGQGSKVILGNVITVPIENSLLYVQPVYVAAEVNPVPQLKDVIVVLGDKAVMKTTLAEAVAAVVPGSKPSTLEQNNGGTTSTTTPTTGPGIDATVQQLLDQAQADFVAADNALHQGDLATFQQKYNDGRKLFDQATARSRGQTTTGSTTTTTAPAGGTTTTSTPTSTSTTSTTTKPS